MRRARSHAALRLGKRRAGKGKATDNLSWLIKPSGMNESTLATARLLIVATRSLIRGKYHEKEPRDAAMIVCDFTLLCFSQGV